MNISSSLFAIQQPVRYVKSGLMMLGLACGLMTAAVAQNMAPAKASTSTAQPRLADSILVVVNNEVITRYEFLERLKSVETRLKSQGGQMPPIQQLQRQLME